MKNSAAASMRGSDIGSSECTEFGSSCVAFNLRKSSQVIGRIYAREMHDAPVRGPLFSLLAVIHRRGPATITALAKDVCLDRTTLTRNLRPLEQRGLIGIEIVSPNRKEVRLLPKGEEALRESLGCWRKAQEKVIGRIGAERWERMREDLSAVISLDESLQ